MAPSDFSKADLDQIVQELTTDEAILLTSGVGFWHTHAIPRLGVPAIKVSDGPNGIRGNHFFMGTPAKCLPSATALGATWDVELIEQVGLRLIAAEAKLRSASVVLGPTCNIQRSPLGGRSFESFSEDPYLSGLITSAYIKGTQDGGIGITVKHFTCNDKELDRLGSDSIVSDRALREIYLMPFMLAQKNSKPWSYMTAYNRINGTHCSENPYLLQKILRDEWKFDGAVMSDWFGVYSIDHAINAGLDLEMPGTNKWRSLDLMTRSIESRKITLRTVKERARNVLKFVQRCAAGAPEVLDGDGEERTFESEEDTALLRRTGASSIVLLKNSGVLPLQAQNLTKKKVAIVGYNAKAVVLSGGGSAALKPSYFVSPYEGIKAALEEQGVEVTYSVGAPAYMTMPTLEYELTTESGERGWTGYWYNHESDDSLTPVDKQWGEIYLNETRCFMGTSFPRELTKRWTFKVVGNLRPRSYDVDFEFGLMVAGRAKLFVDGQLVIDNWTVQRRGESFFNSGTVEEKGIFKIKANQTHKVEVVFCNVRGPALNDKVEKLMDSNPAFQLGGAEVRDGDETMAEAVKLASEADAVIAVVGLNADYETEGYDRTTLALPARTDELVTKVAKANPNTIVVTQSGSAITMPWVDNVAAIVHSWYLGNATGHAIADILVGKVNPAAKLSLTFPKRLQDTPSFHSFHTEHGRIHYSEDIFVGYKWYQHRNIEPLFAFGHGLSYTSFGYSDLKVSTPTITADSFELTVSVTVTNTGNLTGSEVVQVYTTIPETSLLTQVPTQLKGFVKVHDLEAGKNTVVNVKLDKYAVSYWEERIGRWVVEPGVYKVRVGGTSVKSENTPETTFEISKGFEWNGL